MKRTGFLGIAFLAASTTFLTGCGVPEGATKKPDQAINIPKDKAVCVPTQKNGLNGAKVVDSDNRLIVQFGLGSNVFAPENEGVALYPKGRKGSYHFKEMGEFTIEDDSCVVRVGKNTHIYQLAQK